MLVLTRKSLESICIGDDILVTVIEVRGNRVRIGIQAPKDVQVYRGELRISTEEEQEPKLQSV